MGDLFRSEQMALCQMFIQPEAAYASIAQMGESGCVQFRDLNGGVNAFQRKFVTEVRRCDELERKIRFIETEIRKDGLRMNKVIGEMPRAPNPREIVDLEAHLETIESEVHELAMNEVNLMANMRGMTELRQVLENTAGLFSNQEVLNLDINRFRDQSDYLANGQAQQHRGQLGFIAGVIKLERFFAFERMLWRISRGNIFLKRNDLSGLWHDEETGHPKLKTVFVAFFQGEQLKHRIKKVCTGFHASIYPCPSAHNERNAMISDVSVRLQDLMLVLKQTADHRNRVLIAASRHLPQWAIMVKKMKAIYHTLNLFNLDVSSKCLIGEGWVPIRDLPVVQRYLASGSKAVESTIPSFLNIIETDEQPPTYMRTNKFTSGFQSLIDAYGVASYREVNPALYTCITFPFLFAVMFGDLGHGLILFLFALGMCLNENRLRGIKGEIFNIFFSGRYIILLMGLFSMYTGLIYNDIFSKSMNIFGSTWRVRYNTSTVVENPYLQMNPRFHSYGTYPLGMDPIWQLADNKIIFLNSYKMKLSIIFAILHMIFGVVMSLVNYNYFKQRASVVLEFVPQLLFLVLLFGYMVFMMFFKWVKYSGAAENLPETPGCAPSILIIFINMMLFGSNDPLEGCEEYMFDGQNVLQIILVVLAIICIPWMLLGKPVYVLCTRKSMHNDIENSEIQLAADTNPRKVPASDGHGHGHSGGDEPISEVFIQQAIHTIEYVLSTISHTASYLRLWALSLAHAQLSEVLWQMVFSNAFLFGNYADSVLVFFIFGAWAGLTFGILVLIEGLSAFLHTLRLHWVEFMSKFYDGLGYAFEPFSFTRILESNTED